MDKIKRFLDCYIPTETCNLRCHYCYIAQQRLFNKKMAHFTHSPSYIRNSLSQKRLGGICVLNLCAGGETLLSPEILPVVRELLYEGHYVMIVTNGTIRKRFEEIIHWEKDIKQHLMIKFSFHFLEMKRLKLFDTFFYNVKLMKENGIAFTVEVTPSDELIPYISELKKICEQEFGALCHLTIARDDRTGGIDILSEHNFEDYKKIWKPFQSMLFDFKTDIYHKKRKEFCYAGKWSLYINLGSGEIRQCYCGKILDNLYEKIDSPLNFETVGNYCPLPYCYNGHAFLTFGVIPEIDTPSYADMRNRVCFDQSEWLTAEVKNFFNTKLKDNNIQYTWIEQFFFKLKHQIKKNIHVVGRLVLYGVSGFIRVLRLFRHPSCIKDIFQKYRNRFLFWKYIKFPLYEKAWIIGVPEHQNLGDSAIVLAEKKLLRDFGFQEKAIKEISNNEFMQHTPLIRSALHQEMLIGMGGGNMGNVWFDAEEVCRRSFLRNFSDRKVTIFPQTIFYTQDSNGKLEEQNSIAVYNNPQYLLIAREQRSYEKMCELYPLAQKLLTPDIVLYTTAADYGVLPQKRNRILLCLRSDEECNLTAEERKHLLVAAQKTGEKIIQTDMYSDCSITKQNRMKCVQKKLFEFASAQLIITDRLHGMIFAAITGTPCLVFSNNNHKVRGVYEWIKYLPYIKYLENTEQAESYINELLSMKNCVYDNTPLLPYFEQLKQRLTERIS